MTVPAWRTHPSLARIERLLAISLPGWFLLAGLALARPFVDDLPLDTPKGDDWLFYKQLAVSILDGGLRMPGIGSYVLVPHGFLYPYFLALVFALAGVNTAWVYVVQAAMGGACVSLLWTARPRSWSPAAGILFLGLAASTVALDFLLRLSFRLLSESLFLFLFAAAVALLSRLIRRPGLSRALGAGFVLGLAVLSRTSTIVAAMGLLVLWVGLLLRSPAGGRVAAVALVAGFLAGMSPLPVREYAAVGRANVDLITHTADFVPPPDGLAARADYYGRRVLFTLGLTRYVSPAYRPRPHWSVIVAGVLAYLVSRARRRRWPAPVEATVLVFLAGYLGPVLLVAGIDNYGGRMVAMAMPFAALLAASALDPHHARA